METYCLGDLLAELLWSGTLTLLGEVDLDSDRRSGCKCSDRGEDKD